MGEGAERTRPGGHTDRTGAGRCADRTRHQQDPDFAAGREERLTVLVVGAGPTGLVLAAQLHAMGVRTRVVDRQPDRVHESRALGVQPRTLEVLRGIGLADTLVERGNTAVRLRVHGRTATAPITLFDSGLDDTAYPYLLFLSQAETEAILGEYLAVREVPVDRGVELVDFREDLDGVTATLRRDGERGHDGGRDERVHAGYLVGCDGAHSTVRRLAGIPFEGASYPQRFALADLEIDGGLEPGTVHAYPGPQGLLFFFPLGHPATWRMIGILPRARDGTEPRAATSEAYGTRAASPEAYGTRTAAVSEEADGTQEATAPDVAAVPPALTLDDLQTLADGYTGGGLRLRDPAWLTEFRLHHRLAARYREGRVFLAGDAAHVHSPAGAQGMNTGILDAWNLGWKLALVDRGQAPARLLDTYEAERRPFGKLVLRATDRVTSIATSRAWLPRLARTHVAPRLMPLVLRSAPGRGYGFRMVSQLAVGYRGSQAVEEGEPRLGRGPRAGDRLPDARVTAGDAPAGHGAKAPGRPGWLHEALAPPGFHLLLCGGPGGWVDGPVTALRERYADILTVHHLAPAASPSQATGSPDPAGSPDPVVSPDPAGPPQARTDVDALVDVEGKAFARLGVHDTAQYLVRPDGHVAYRCAGTDLTGLERYLARWLPVPERGL